MNSDLVLYHGSPNQTITRFEPRYDGVRSKTDGALVFATANRATAALFTVKVKGWRVSIGQVYGVTYYVCDNEPAFVAAGKRAAIYEFSTEGFSMDPTKGLGPEEYVSRTPVTPQAKTLYDSALEAMMQSGVQLFFVSAPQLNQIEAAFDYGIGMLRTLESENMKHHINYRPFAAY